MKRDKKPYDSAFKDLSEQDPQALLLLVGALPPGATVKPLPRELSAPMLLTDQPYEVIAPSAHFIAHIEAQTRYEVGMPERFVEYDTQLWLKWRLPVRSYLLVFLPDGMPAVPPTTVTIKAGGLTLTVEYTVVKLWEVSAADALASGSESLLPFVSLMQGGLAELEQSARLLNQIADEKRRQELALHFVMVGRLRYNRTDLLDLLGRITMVPLHILKDSPFYQEILEEGREEGLERGREEGREEGRAVGKVEALVRILQRLIAKRFPGFAVELKAEQFNDVEKLEQLCTDFYELNDEIALQARLAELSSRE